MNNYFGLPEDENEIKYGYDIPVYRSVDICNRFEQDNILSSFHAITETTIVERDNNVKQLPIPSLKRDKSYSKPYQLSKTDDEWNIIHDIDSDSFHARYEDVIPNGCKVIELSTSSSQMNQLIQETLTKCSVKFSYEANKNNWICEYSCDFDYVSFQIQTTQQSVSNTRLELIRSYGSLFLFSEIYHKLSAMLVSGSEVSNELPSKIGRCCRVPSDAPSLGSVEMEEAVQSLIKWLKSDPMEACMAVANLAIEQSDETIQKLLLKEVANVFSSALQSPMQTSHCNMYYHNDDLYSDSASSTQHSAVLLPIIEECILFSNTLMNNNIVYVCDMKFRYNIITSLLPILSREAICGNSSFIRGRSIDVMEKYVELSIDVF